MPTNQIINNTALLIALLLFLNIFITTGIELLDKHAIPIYIVANLTAFARLALSAKEDQSQP